MRLQPFTASVGHYAAARSPQRYHVGKTGFMTQIAHNAARAGYAVAIHAADESAERIAGRIGQAIGLSQEDLEQRDPHALAHLADHVATLPLIVLDQDEDGVSIEDTHAALLALAKQIGARGALLCADSIQRLRAVGTDRARDQRARAEAAIAALLAAGDCAVLATSTLSRGAYRNPKDKIAAMAAFKDSGDIEYAARLALVLQSVPGEAGKLVDVDVPKNKAGRVEGEDAAFRLRLDRARCRYVDEPRPADGGEDDDMEARLDAAARKLISKVVAFVAKTGTEGASGRDISDGVTGKTDPLRRAPKLAAQDGALVAIGNPPRYFIPSCVPSEPEAAE